MGCWCAPGFRGKRFTVADSTRRPRRPSGNPPFGRLPLPRAPWADWLSPAHEHSWSPWFAIMPHLSFWVAFRRYPAGEAILVRVEGRASCGRGVGRTDVPHQYLNGTGPFSVESSRKKGRLPNRIGRHTAAQHSLAAPRNAQPSLPYTTDQPFCVRVNARPFFCAPYRSFSPTFLSAGRSFLLRLGRQ